MKTMGYEKEENLNKVIGLNGDFYVVSAPEGAEVLIVGGGVESVRIGLSTSDLHKLQILIDKVLK